MLRLAFLFPLTVRAEELHVTLQEAPPTHTHRASFAFASWLRSLIWFYLGKRPLESLSHDESTRRLKRR